MRVYNQQAAIVVNIFVVGHVLMDVLEAVVVVANRLVQLIVEVKPQQTPVEVVTMHAMVDAMVDAEATANIVVTDAVMAP